MQGSQPRNTVPPSQDPDTLKGVFPVLCTPFTGDGELDEPSLRSLVEYVLAAGVDGLVVGGVASEVYKLADEERAKVLAVVVHQVRGRVPIIAGTSAECTERAVSLSRAAQEAGAACVMVMPPLVTRHVPSALFQYYHAIAQGLEIPVMVQDHPALANVQMPAAFLGQLVNEVSGIRYIKVEAPPTGPKSTEVLRLTDGRAILFGGLAGQNFLEELHRGFVGTLPGSGFPDVYVSIHKAFRSGNVEEARTIHHRAMPLMRYVSQSVEFSFHAYKEILRRKGVIATRYVRGPSVPPDNHALEELDALLAETGI